MRIYLHEHHADILTHGLADGCILCDDFADNPFESTDELLESLFDRIRDESHARSVNESIAMGKVLMVMRLMREIDKLKGCQQLLDGEAPSMEL